MKKLWVVSVAYEAYVLAETEDDAKVFSSEIERWEDYPTVKAEQWDGRELYGWDDSCNVYGTEDNLSLSRAKRIHAAVVGLD